ncbi:MAG TPA: VWA domain-containing protein [Thermoanaerobaculia bacterium]|jgi:VWFA-related protein|nr:VWA domain-containing protein [Thermoanaerobaculia bacterium]
MKRFLTILILVALSLPTFAQEATPALQEEIDVNAVLLDVIVTDRKGNHILGLGADDFVIKENGVAQTIDSVDYFTNRRLLDQREEQAPFKVERVREDRYFVIFFDKPSDPPLFDQLTQARQAAKNFVDKEMKETDLVAIVGHDVRLKVYSDFSNDKKHLALALNEATKFGLGLKSAPTGDGPSILRNVDIDKMIDDTGTVYQALDFLADGLRPIKARKNLVLFSPGIADREEPAFAGGLLMHRSRYLDPALESLNAANVSVYGVQLQRNADSTPLFHQRLEELSDSTGGRYFRINVNFNPALEQIENTNNGYYLVTYRAPHAKGRTGFQKVDVEVKNPEFKVVARSGYQFGS